ncbi:MAG: PTS transporter subunit EIIC [Bacillota bacterium]
MKRGLHRFAAAAFTPIAVLPAAAILLALGNVLPIPVLSRALWAAGEGLFQQLGLIFAVGIAVGLSQGDGTAGLAAATSFVIINAVARSIDPATQLGVLAGLVAGLSAAWAFRRYSQVRFPEYLSFFEGRRFVPIAVSLVSVVWGLVMGATWPAVQKGIVALGDWMSGAGMTGVFVYGALERLLIPTGLHHFLNGIVLLLMGSFEGATGDLARFFAGDPTAGFFMGGAYAIKLFGLPAACLAMMHEAKRPRAVKGLMLTAALTSLLTGITEPVEFAFLFTAPILFAFHALLAGSSFAVNWLLGITHGFASTAGLLEFVINWHRAQRAWLILPLGLLYAAAYYAGFRVLIRRLNLATPGRLEAEENLPGPEVPAAEGASTAPVIVQALGGATNILSVDACLTRLRVVLQDASRVDFGALKASGAVGWVGAGTSVLQVVYGTRSHQLARAVREYLGNSR